jgi:hypothetical protein
MQDKYVGDAGDFAKYGLLRQLLGACSFGQTLTLAVLWYLVDDEAGVSDGKHTSYLRDNRIRVCDPSLHDALKILVDTGNRNVDSIERSGILPPERTVFFSDRLPTSRSRKSRDASVVEARQEWFQRALIKSRAADLVFLDPDNGIEVRSISLFSPRSNKYVYLNEVAAIAERDQSLLIYQHHDRTAPAELQIIKVLNKLRQAVPQSRGITSFTFRKGSVRSFFLIFSNSHSDMLRANVNALQNNAWQRYLVITGA